MEVAYSPIWGITTLTPMPESIWCTLRYTISCSSIGVPPRPFTITDTSSPSARGMSFTIVLTRVSAISSAVIIFFTSIPASPWMPMPTSISSSAIVKVGLPTFGTMHGERATPMVRMFSSAFSATAATSSRLIILSAAAPATLNAYTMPATPRRLSAFSLGELATSSRTSTCFVSISSNSTSSHAIWKLNLSPL